MKLVFRADDFGYTKTFNDGTIEAIEHGVVTSLDIMMDTPGAEDALVRAKDYPWLSIGWHTHFWGSPCADAKLIPSMVDENGRFKFRKNRKLMESVVYEEALIELRAEVEKCIAILGKAPDISQMLENEDHAVGRAKRKVCDEYGIRYGFMNGKDPKTKQLYSCKPEYEALNIHELENYGRPGMTVDTFHLYDPVGCIMEAKTDTDWIYVRSQHPGYLDSYILAESSCNIHRPKDVQALCSEELKAWIRENGIELINLRDALYGTQEYQNYLRNIGSDLYVGDMTR